MLKDVVTRIESKLEQKGLSASKASELAGLSRDAIRNLQRSVNEGRPGGASTRTITALASVLDVSPAWLLSGDGPADASGNDDLDPDHTLFTEEEIKLAIQSIVGSPAMRNEEPGFIAGMVISFMIQRRRLARGNSQEAG